MGRTEETIVTHLDKALGQDVLKETVDEFLGRQRAELGLAGVGVVAEGDLVILDLLYSTRTMQRLLRATRKM